MRRINNLFQKIISIENLMLADQKAQKGKSKQYGVVLHNKNQEENILKLHEMLKNKTYQTSEYKVFKVFEPKERDVYQLPFFPDRICHHAVMNVLEPIFVAVFTADSYSCIKNGKRVVFTGSKNLMDLIQQVPKDKFPFKTTIAKQDKRLEFT